MVHSPKLASLSEEERNSLINRLLERQNNICFVCNKKIDLELQKDVDIDHIEAISKGGIDDECNFAVTHSSCNRSKNDSDLFLARAIYKIKNLQENFKKEYLNNPEKYKATHQEANLGDLLLSVGGSKYSLKYKIENNKFVYTMEEMFGNQIFEVPVFIDKLSKARFCFVELPIEYCYHDDDINPRPISDRVSSLIEEFYKGNPQLQISLARINEDDKKVYIFDGQHKSSAQIALCSKTLLVRLFVDFDKKRLFQTNTRAGKELKQIEFNKNIMIQLHDSEYKNRIEMYQKHKGYTEDDLHFSEIDLINAFNTEKDIKKLIIDSQISSIMRSSENKLTDYIDTFGRGKTVPISMSSLNKIFFPLFIDSKTFCEESIGNEKSARNIENKQIVKLMNIIAEKICINMFDDNVGTAQIENKLKKGEGNLITDSHLRSVRLCKEEIMYGWLSVLNDVINVTITSSLFKSISKGNYFKTELDDSNWKIIEMFFEKLVSIPFFITRSDEIIFYGRQSNSFWKEVFQTGNTPDGRKILAEPLNYQSIFNQNL